MIKLLHHHLQCWPLRFTNSDEIKELELGRPSIWKRFVREWYTKEESHIEFLDGQRICRLVKDVIYYHNISNACPVQVQPSLRSYMLDLKNQLDQLGQAEHPSLAHL